MLGTIISFAGPVVGTLVSPTDYAEFGSAHLLSRRRWEVAYMNFELTFPAHLKPEAELVRNLIKRARGDTDMWFDGGEFCNMSDFTDVGIGDGITTQFKLPDFNIFGSSLIVKVNDIVDPLWTIVEAPGVLVMVTAPPAEAIITAKYARRVRCRFMYAEEAALVQTDNFKMFATEKLTLREVP